MKNHFLQTETALSHFSVSIADIQQVLQMALSEGGDYADLFFEDSLSNSLQLRDGHVNSVSSGMDFGVGVRVLSGDRTGYAYVENTHLKDLLRAAKTAAAIAMQDRFTAPIGLNWKEMPRQYYQSLRAWDSVRVEERMPYLQRLNERVHALDERVSKVVVGLSDGSSRILFANSEGQVSADERPMVSLSVSCILEANGQFENGRASRSYRMGYEFLTEELLDILAKEAVLEASTLFDAVKPKGGEMPVVFGSGGSGIFLHEAIGHAFEADFNRKGTSIFSDRLHQKICPSFVNVVDDGTVMSNRGAVGMDDEGVSGQKTYLVREGVLTSYLHDRISARHYGVEPTGNGRRASFRNIPMPRMRATYMEAGQTTELDLIASVKNGVYVHSFTNGQVQIGAGDFTFYVKLGYRIENGQLKEPIRDINIIGNGPAALADVLAVGSNFELDNGTWTCGKEGQSCPVTCGMPSALVKTLIVGGE